MTQIEIIKGKTDEELIIILCRSKQYQPDFIELVKMEIREVRNINSIEDFIKGKSDEELIRYYDQFYKYPDEFIELILNELKERDIFVEVKEHKTENRPREYKIHGWLTFFLVMIGLGSIFSVVYFFTKTTVDDYKWELQNESLSYVMSIIGLFCDMIFTVGCAILGLLTIIAFYKYQPNAVGLGKSYLIISFISNLVGLSAGEYESSGFGSLHHIIRSLVWGVIWFWYLCRSEQVNSLFPKDPWHERKMYKRDKIFLFSIVVPIVIWMLFAFGFGLYEVYQEEKFYGKYIINESSLAANEYTDGLIIFELPDGLILEKLEREDDNVYFTLHNEDISASIYSIFDDNDTQEYFDKIIEKWADDYFEDFAYTITDYWHEILNANSLYTATYQYHSEPVIAWSFVMLFNKETGKCCIISYYSGVETNHLEELINSVRFK